jgi:eukaryotic-like serine/threonine-protein kinase
VLLEQGAITASDRADVERLLERKLAHRQGQVAESLAAAAGEEVRRVLAALDDPEIQSTLARMPQAGGHVLLSTVAFDDESRERYTLTRLHAQGGIGRVWLARDVDLGREVALKELRPERAENPEVWARFLQEARITGQLEHPGIVPVYELARRQDDQQPFYTMRFVRGRTLSEAVRSYHDKRASGHASPVDLLGLLSGFVSVCNAVAYAHARGVIHRDLKGQNVVLGDFGEVMVLDWGLAKLVDQVESAGDLPPVVLENDARRDATVVGQALGTPAYMPPEQAAGQLDQIDERSDVYGLGAILYEILTGKPPFSGSDTDDILRKVREEEPARIKTAFPSVHPALEAICAKAMAKQPEQRYQTAGQLGRDIQRFLADEPISAWREPILLRTRRWLGRHRTVLTAGAAAIVVAIVSLSVATVKLSAANESQRLATRNQLLATKNAEKQKLIAELRKIEADKGKALAKQQATNALTHAQVAQDAVYHLIHEISNNRKLQERELRPLRMQLISTALKATEELVERSPEHDPELLPYVNVYKMVDLGRAYDQLGLIMYEIGSKQEAIEAFQKNIAILDKLIVKYRSPPGCPFRQLRGTAYEHLGMVLGQMGKTDEALESYREATNVWNNVCNGATGWKPLETQGRLYLASLAANIGEVEEESARLDDAQRSYREAIDGLKRLLAEFKQDAESRSVLEMYGGQNALTGYLGATLTSFASTEIQLGEWDDAANRLRNAIDLLEKTVEGPSAARSDCRQFLGRAYLVLGSLHSEAGRIDESLKALKRGEEIVGSLAAENPQVINYQNALLRAKLLIAHAQRQSDQLEAARATLEKADELGQAIGQTDRGIIETQRLLAEIDDTLGAVHRELGHAEQALEWHGFASEILLEHVGPIENSVSLQSERARNLKETAAALANLGRLDDARAALDEASGLLTRLTEQTGDHPGYHLQFGELLTAVGQLQVRQGQTEAARATFRAGLAHIRRALKRLPEQGHPGKSYSDLLHQLSQVERTLENPAAAAQAETNTNSKTL